MKHQIYSKIHKIPSGIAAEKYTKGCLVLEGGAFRGLYNQGALDALMQNDINLSCVIGVSAGALAGMNYVSGQIGRSARANLGYRHDGNYIGVKAIKKSHSVIRLDFLLQDFNAREIINEARFNNPAQRYIAVATNCETGETAYFEKGRCQDIFSAIKASASMPYVSPAVMVEGVPYLDGGCSCKIPYKWAVEEGYEKILVIRTREEAFRKKLKPSSMAKKVYGKYPEFAIRLDNSDAAYNRQCDEIDRLKEEGRLFVMAPSKPVTVGRVESDMEKLGELYWLGYEDTLKRLPEIKAYLDIDEA